MADETLLEYIKETTAAGFAEERIRQQLLKAGWNEIEIAEGFAAVKGAAAPVAPLPPISPITPVTPVEPINRHATEPTITETPGWFSRHKGTLVTIILIIILLPLLAYGGYWGYQKYFVKEGGPIKNTGLSPNPSPSPGEGNAAVMKPRDEQRIKDIAALQTALASYYEAKKLYPPTLADLVAEQLMLAVPTDPKSKEPYLYKALGDPALHYSLSFLLETRMGTLSAGLQVVSSQSRLPAELIQNQEDIVKGAAAALAAQDLLITALDQSPFYPQEEVRVDIAVPEGKDLVSVFLVIDDLELVDQSLPFSFSFSAPKEPGTYDVRIFAFDRNGTGYLQQTSLTVSK